MASERLCHRTPSGFEVVYGLHRRQTRPVEEDGRNDEGDRSDRPFIRISGHQHILLGYDRFRNAVAEGTQDPNVSYLIAYAQYLSNGGTPSGWGELTDTDIMLMQAYYNEQKYKELESQAILIAKHIAKLFGGGD